VSEDGCSNWKQFFCELLISYFNKLMFSIIMLCLRAAQHTLSKVVSQFLLSTEIRCL